MYVGFKSSNKPLRLGLSAAATAAGILQQHVCGAFQPPSTMIVQSFLQQQQQQQQLLLSSWTMNSFWVSDAASANVNGGTDVQAILNNAASAIGGFGDTLRNVAVAITAILFLFVGLILMIVYVIIPAVAEKELQPGMQELWEEYTAKLQEGETMEDRPDLMQEYRAKLQSLLDEKMERYNWSMEWRAPSSSSSSDTFVDVVSGRDDNVDDDDVNVGWSWSGSDSDDGSGGSDGGGSSDGGDGGGDD
eukprot:scaffold1609_cov91-Cylindrotheca_fusiformis.AAC.4